MARTESESEVTIEGGLQVVEESVSVKECSATVEGDMAAGSGYRANTRRGLNQRAWWLYERDRRRLWRVVSQDVVQNASETHCRI